MRPLSLDTHVLLVVSRALASSGSPSHKQTREVAMKVITCALSSVAVAATLSVAQAADVPDALSVEWQGKHPCEKLFEDAQVLSHDARSRRELCTSATHT